MSEEQISVPYGFRKSMSRPGTPSDNQPIERFWRTLELIKNITKTLLAQGVAMKQIQEWLGHSDMGTTVNIKNPYEQLKESKQFDFVCIFKRANHKQKMLVVGSLSVNNYQDLAVQFFCIASKEFPRVSVSLIRIPKQ